MGKGKAAAAAGPWTNGGVAGSGFPPPNLLQGYDVKEHQPVLGHKLFDSKHRLVAGVDQTELVDPWMIADTDSKYAEFQSVRIHYKRGEPNSTDLEAAQTNGTVQQLGVPAVLLHGFGASVFSWEKFLSPLAGLLGAPTVAFDRPAFGLTARLKPSLTNEQVESHSLNPYSQAFSAAATLAFIDLLQSRQAILVAHSAGAIVAANAFLHAPERVAALVLVAPALPAPLIRSNSSRDRQREREKQAQKEEKEREAAAAAAEEKRPFGALVSRVKAVLAALLMMCTWFFSLMVAAVAHIRNGLKTLQRKFLTLLLRSPFALWLIRELMDKYGRWAVRCAWFSKEGPGKHVIDGYTKPLRCKDWDKALAEFVIAIAASDSKHPPVAQRLEEITCPVLVVTGDTDRLVPAWNARRLASQLPRAKCQVIQNCGHLPQEERPDELLRIINQFIQEELLEPKMLASTP